MKICYAGEHVKGSPFIVQVGPTNNNLKVNDVRISGIERNFTVLEGKSIAFQIEMPDKNGIFLENLTACDSLFNSCNIFLLQHKTLETFSPVYLVIIINNQC